MNGYGAWVRAYLVHHGLIRPEVQIRHVWLERPVTLQIGDPVTAVLYESEQGCEWLEDIEEGPEAWRGNPCVH